MTMSSDEKFTIQHERLDHKIARKNEKKTILTEDQYAKWEKMNHRRRIHSKGKREGHSRGCSLKEISLFSFLKKRPALSRSFFVF